MIERFAKVSLPFVISCVCPSSGAAEGAKHDHHSEISARSYLAADTVPLWPKEVPFYFSGPTLWASSLVRALMATGRETLLPRIRLDRLYAACQVFAPQYRLRIDEARAGNPGSVSTIGFASSVCWIWSLRARAALGNLAQKLDGSIRGNQRAVGLTHIGEVVTYIADRFDQHPFKEVFKP